MTPKRAVFLDRDGTINENRTDHVKSLAEFVLLPGALEAIRRLAETDLAIILVSNQSVINRGLTSAQTVQSINDYLRDTVHAYGGRLDDIYICPHRPDENCRCRKPRPGLLYQARDEHNLDLAASYLVGDAITDVELAQSVGCRPILVLTGRGASHLSHLTAEQRRITHIAENLERAVEWIIREEERRGAGANSP
jgi:D-glycero-D-manno-heptose 1,7-bisphosphate phosphatase